ncbi:hypothetical protein L917_01571 [Phytophthora nicotianae]|nr:hypothetical protein L917_01571 [Phytophthora nicotianae]ETO84371.1 hypothetical protein F444_01708 [Phytophthora nicotianae P1976]
MLLTNLLHNLKVNVCFVLVGVVLIFIIFDVNKGIFEVRVLIQLFFIHVFSVEEDVNKLFHSIGCQAVTELGMDESTSEKFCSAADVDPAHLNNCFAISWSRSNFFKLHQKSWIGSLRRRKLPLLRRAVFQLSNIPVEQCLVNENIVRAGFPEP